MTVWQRASRLVNAEAETITGAAILIGFFGLASRVLGLVRDRILAGTFGAAGLDVYYASFQVPDLLYSVLIVGAISTAFIPIFAGYFQRDRDDAWRVASGVFALFSVVFVAFALAAIVFAPQLMRVVAPGFTGERFTTAVELTRIMFLSPVLFGLANVLASVLQYFRRFFVVSAAPVLYNIGIIVGVLVFVPRFGVRGLAWGVVLGAALYFAFHMVGLKGLGFRLRFDRSMLHPGVWRIIRQTLPRAIGVAVNQLSSIVIVMIASGLAAGSIGIFNLASNLQGVPIGLFGVAFASAAFPKLSRAWAERDEAGFRAVLSFTLRQAIFFVLPLAVLFIVLRAQIVRVVYGLGKFGWADTRLTAAALALFAFSVVAQAVIPLLARAFYSRHKTAAPVATSIATVALTLALALVLVPLLAPAAPLSEAFAGWTKVSGIADIRILALVAAFSLAALCNLVVLFVLLEREVGNGFSGEVLVAFGKMLVGAAALAATTYLGLAVLAPAVDMQTVVGVFLQGAGAGLAGLAVYAIAAHLLKLPEVETVWSVFRHLAFWRKFVPQTIREEDKQ